MPALNLLIADDHDLIRRGLRSLLEEQAGWKVVAEASNGREAVDKAMALNPDVTLLDIRMPVLDGLGAAREIIKAGSKTKILILTTHESDALIQEVIDVGARGYVFKSDAFRDLVKAIETVRYNKTFFTGTVDRAIKDGFLKKSKSSDESGVQNRLTPRQREILKLLAEGKRSKEVAKILGISVKTLDTHRADMMERLNCHTVTDLIRYALRNEIVDA